MTMDYPASGPSIAFRSPRSQAEWEAYFDLRWRLLRAPWQQPRGSEKDQREEESIHLIAVGPLAEVLAAGRLHFNSPVEAQVRFMAVDPEAQGRGIGSGLLRELEHRAAAAGAKSIVLNARDQAQEFYRKHGYQIVGAAETLFAEVKHVRMQKDL